MRIIAILHKNVFFSMCYLPSFPLVIIRTSILLNMVYIISLFFRKTWIFSQQTPPPISGRLTLTTLMICCWMDSFLPLSAPSSTSWKTLVFPGLWMWVVTGMITEIAPVELLWTAIECFVTFPKKTVNILWITHNKIAEYWASKLFKKKRLRSI